MSNCCKTFYRDDYVPNKAKNGNIFHPSNAEFKRGGFRMRGEVVEVYPSYHQEAYRVDLCD